MQTLQLDARPSPMSQYVAAFFANARKVRPAAELPGLKIVRPEVKLSERHVARYAQICGFKPSQGVPATYPHMLAFPFHMELLCSDRFPFPVIGLVHLTNSIQQHQALRVGDRVRVEVEFGEMLAHEKGQAFSILSRVYRDDELVWNSTSVNLRLGAKLPGGRAYASSLLEGAPLSRQTEWQADSGIGRRYGRVSSDLNPIHLSAFTAKIFGFKRAIAHGMWTKAKALATILPATPVNALDVHVEFKTPLFLPATASLWTARTAQDTLFEVRNAKGDRPHLRGKLVY